MSWHERCLVTLNMSFEFDTFDRPIVDWDCFDRDLIRRLGGSTTYGSQQRHLILPSTAVTGGVLYTATMQSGEALVVDPDEDPDPYEEAYEEVLEEITAGGVIREDRLPDALDHVVGAVFPMVDPRTVDRFLEDVARERGLASCNGMELNLADCMRAHIGECRHMAALGACMVERLQSERRVHSIERVRLDMNLVKYPRAGYAAHAWDRLEREEPDPLIVDPGEFCGPLSAAHARRNDPQPSWPYWRPEDEVHLHVINHIRKLRVSAATGAP